MTIRNDAFLLASHFVSEPLIELFLDIQDGVRYHGEAKILLHNDYDIETNKYSNVECFSFNSSILESMKYKPISNKLLPGSNHFSLLYFFKNNPGYDYYWYIENDVRFNGKWMVLFDTFCSCNDDLITCSVRKVEDEPSWYWWNSLHHPTHILPLKNRLASFNPIYRISNRALSFIDNKLIEGWSGHHEVLLPTLLSNSGFSVADFGGNGSFVPHAFKNKFYIAHNNESNESVAALSTMRYRPIFLEVGNIENMLYHPVKII